MSARAMGRRARRAQQIAEQARGFVRDYTAGLNVRDLRRMFDRDAVEAYRVLTREYDAEPKRRRRRWLHRARIVFLGLSYKLSPARRVLFVVSLALALIGLIQPSRLELGSRGLVIDFSPVWFLAALAALLWLFALELVDRVRVRDELEVARQLQSDLLPGAAPELPGYRFAHSYRTANEVGGDYYDFQLLADGRLALLMGDASGHGIAAGLLMAIANATLKTALDVDPDPPAVARLLNAALCRTGDRRAFMTLFYALLEPAGGRLDYVCAGHPFPLLRRAAGGIEELGAGTLPLGLRDDARPTAGTATLAPGDSLVLFTDGLPEALGTGGQAFGFRRLRELVTQPGDPAAVHQRILAAFDRHVGDEPLTDDLTLVVCDRV